MESHGGWVSWLLQGLGNGIQGSVPSFKIQTKGNDMKETQRTGWLGDEDALEEYYYGPICESCGLRGEDCTCDAQEEEPPEEE